MENQLEKGKKCIGQDVYDCQGNHGIIIDFFVENGNKSKVTIQYDDGTSNTREKYAVQHGKFQKPYKDDIEECLLSGEWAYIPTFNNRYIISKQGEIKATTGRYKGKLLSPSINKQGYAMIALQKLVGDKESRTLVRVHRLMALTFLGELQNGDEINHIDGNKSNNALSNLEIISRKSNNKKYIDLEEMGLSTNEIEQLHSFCNKKGISLKELIATKLKEEME